MLRNHIAQKQLQKLSPQQIQLMKLLQIPTASIEQRIQEELEINPALEDYSDVNAEDDYITEPTRELETETEDTRDDYTDDYEEDYSEAQDTFEDTLSDYLEHYDDDDSYKSFDENSYNNEEDTKHRELVDENTFYEYVKSQLGLLSLDEKEYIIATQIIGSLKEDGYLEREIDALVDDLLFSANLDTTEEEVLAVLKKVQSLEPAGIAARNLQECLILQLDRKLTLEKERYTSNELLSLRLAKIILSDYFDEFTKKHYPKLLQSLSLDRDDLRMATDEILKLNPKPGAIFSSGTKQIQQFIIPDFIVTNENGELQLSLNGRNAPDLRVNNQYKQMLLQFEADKRDKQKREAATFVRQKIDSARWFIDAIRQRQNTMLNTMYAVLAYQQEYFLSGDERKLKPMILKDIADMTGLDISTISRVANSKYVQTEFGTKLLKDLFSEALQNEDGEEVSTVEVKKILSDIINNENKRKPLSDEQIRDILEKRGYNIARRTVAKYREQLNFPVGRLRKEI